MTEAGIGRPRCVERRSEALPESRGREAGREAGTAEAEGSTMFSKEPCSDSDAEMGAKTLQTDFCGLFVVFWSDRICLRSRGDSLLKGHHPLEPKNRSLSHEDFTKEATRVCGGNFNISEKIRNCVVDFHALALEVSHLCKEKACAKGLETGAKHFVEGCFVQCGGREVHQCQKYALVRQLFTD